MKECTIDCRISAKIKTNKTISEKDSRKTRLKHCLPSNILVFFHKILFKKNHSSHRIFRYEKSSEV